MRCQSNGNENKIGRSWYIWKEPETAYVPSVAALRQEGCYGPAKHHVKPGEGKQAHWQGAAETNNIPWLDLFEIRTAKQYGSICWYNWSVGLCDSTSQFHVPYMAVTGEMQQFPLTCRGCNHGHQSGDRGIQTLLHFLSCLSNPLPCFLNVPAGAGGCARWPPEVPSGLNHAVILKHCFAQLDTGLVGSFLHSYNKASNININSSTDITKHMNADTAFSGNCLCQTKCFRCWISFGYE